MRTLRSVVVELAERLEGAAALPYWRRARHLAPEDHTIVRRYAIRAVDVLPPLESLELVEDWLKQAGQLPPEGLTAVVRSLAHERRGARRPCAQPPRRGEPPISAGV